MAGRLSDAWLDELRSKVSIEEVVSEYVRLRQKGKRFWGLCPFHNEKTPSFSVDSESQLYYCFGCHQGGTVIHFVMALERMEFMEAVKYLAERAHMELPETSQGPSDGVAREERERIVAESLGAMDASCDGCSAGMYEMYEDYIEGRRELREINMEYRKGYVRGSTKPDRIGCGMG